MKPVKGFSKLRHLPITAKEFQNAYRSLWKGRSETPWRLGLAISGGVDSMALAVLYRNLRTSGYPHVAQYARAFIVDHGAREGSDIEAKRVASNLRRLGLKSEILTIHWPDGVHPSELSNFESQARTLRYQALGCACRDHNISELFLGHHEDDQAETVLMRIATGHKGLSLQGIVRSANIPECYGIHGVYQSGGWSQNPRFDLRNEVVTEQKDTPESPPSMEMEKGGITIHRPLLSFSKNRLEATCRATGTRWVEDSTNKDRTLTRRNAVRYLLEQHRLPEALSKDSLVALSLRMHNKSIQRDSSVQKAFQSCDIEVFDARVGGLVVRFPKNAIKSFKIPFSFRERKRREAQPIASHVIRRVVDLVSPQKTVELENLRVPVSAIFPDTNDPEILDLERHFLPPSFTAAGVSFRRLYCPLVASPEDNKPSRMKSISLDDKYVWMLTRQPYKAGTAPSITIPATTSSPHPTLSLHEPAPKDPSTTTSASHPYWTPFHLFDNRFWIRIYNPTSQALVLRTFFPSDLKPFRLSLSAQQLKLFDTLLKAAAPGKVRWTLPVIARTEADGGGVIAVPTLRIGTQRFGEAGTTHGKDEQGAVRWEVRYKAIDIGQRDETVIIR
ncbi:MAG: hypothetical protein M1819_004905 [Sarea resinae]|nr:MAG: hypothetical protein M1819_004905 [Sarea resinae]